MGRYNKRSRFSGFSGRAATFSWHHPKIGIWIDQQNGRNRNLILTVRAF